MEIKVQMSSESAGVRKKSVVDKAHDKMRDAKAAARKKRTASTGTGHSVVAERRSKVAASRTKPKSESVQAIQLKIDKLSHDRDVISAEIKELRAKLRSARAKTSPVKR